MFIKVKTEDYVAHARIMDEKANQCNMKCLHFLHLSDDCIPLCSFASDDFLAARGSVDARLAA